MIKAICLKDLKLFFSDKKSVLITFLLPILLISLFAFAFGGIGNGNSEPKVIKLLLTDLDNTTESKNLIKSLDSIKGIKLIPTTLEKATNVIRKGKYLGVLVLKNGFQTAIANNESVPLELKYDASREIEVGMLQALLMEKLMQSIGKKAVTNNIKNYLNKEFGALTPNMKNRIVKNVTSSDATKTTNIIDFKMTSVLKDKNKNTNFGLIPIS